MKLLTSQKLEAVYSLTLTLRGTCNYIHLKSYLHSHLEIKGHISLHLHSHLNLKRHMKLHTS